MEILQLETFLAVATYAVFSRAPMPSASATGGKRQD